MTQPFHRRTVRGRVAAFASSVALAATGYLAQPASAQTGAQLLLEPFPKELTLDANADVYLYENGHGKGSDADFRLGIVETDGKLRMMPGDVASPRLGYAAKYFDLDTAIPGLPDRLVDMSVGVAMPVGKIFDDWVVGVSAGIGYAGDSFFGDGNAYYGRATIGVFKQLGEKDSIAFGLDYDGNRTFKPDIPLPGFAYIKRIDQTLLLTVGVPVTSIEWRPRENLRLELSYLLVDNFSARAGYEVAKGLELYGTVGQRSDAFFLDGLPDANDRLLFQQRRAEVGINWRTKDAGVGDQDLELTLAVGYAWAGEFGTGFDQSNSDMVSDLSDEPYVRFGLQMRF